MLLGWNSKYGFRISMFFIDKEGKDVPADTPSTPENPITEEQHVYFFSRYNAKQYAEKRLNLKPDQYMIRKEDSERWELMMIIPVGVDDILIPDYNDAIE